MIHRANCQRPLYKAKGESDGQGKQNGTDKSGDGTFGNYQKVFAYQSNCLASNPVVSLGCAVFQERELHFPADSPFH